MSLCGADGLGLHGAVWGVYLGLSGAAWETFWATWEACLGNLGSLSGYLKAVWAAWAACLGGLSGQAGRPVLGDLRSLGPRP